jgi:hypothetical protein
LVNHQGEVIGIVTFKIRGTENLNFAIPINYLRGLMDSSQPAISLDEMRLKLSSTPDVSKSEGFPPRWKSLVTGTTKIIRRDGDRIYIETQIPDAEKNAGGFNLAELEKKGDIFGGTLRVGGVCQYYVGLGVYARSYPNRFSDQTEIKITKIDPTRIEGRVMQRPSGAKFDCRKGTYSKPPSEWVSFDWIPE